MSLTTTRKAFFYALLVCIPVLFLETIARTYFAFQVGPHVLLYGTGYSRYQEQFDPKGTLAKRMREEKNVGLHENVSAGYSKYHPNQKLHDRDEFGNTIEVAINSHGFRGKDFKLEKEPGVIRIVTLGASSTFGFKDHDDQTYPYYMEQFLNEALPRVRAQPDGSRHKSVRAFEVINLGVPHLKSDQIYALFVQEGLALKPDFVTFYEGINDAAWTGPAETSVEMTKETLKAIPLANEVFRELRYRFLSVALVGMLISQNKTEYSEQDLKSQQQWKQERFIANLQRIHEACKQNGATLIVANQQATDMEETREKLRGLSYEAEQTAVRQKLSTSSRVGARSIAFMLHKDLMDAERQWAVTNGIPHADVIDAMDLSRQNLVTWVHLNAAGNRVIASVLSNTILQKLDTEVTIEEREGPYRPRQSVAPESR
jgi:lysophospholipase L1-like esterase